MITMTEPTAQPTQPTTDLVATGGKLAALPGQTLQGLFSALFKADTVPSVEPVLPQPIVLTDEQVQALTELADVLAELKLPKTRRLLTVTERQALGKALKTVKVAGSAISASLASLRTTLFNHLDVDAERRNLAGPDTPRDKDGFYLLPGKGDGFVREVSAGTPTMNAEALAQLEADGKLTHKQYLKATRAVRVVDEEGVLGLIAEDPEVLVVLREAIVPARRGSVALKAK